MVGRQHAWMVSNSGRQATKQRGPTLTMMRVGVAASMRHAPPPPLPQVSETEVEASSPSAAWNADTAAACTAWHAAAAAAVLLLLLLPPPVGSSGRPDTVVSYGSGSGYGCACGFQGLLALSISKNNAVWVGSFISEQDKRT